MSAVPSRPDAGNHVMTISEITAILKEVIETTFPFITVTGEISNFRPASSGHWYFTLKDEHASLSAVLFRNSQKSVPFRPKDGQQVVVRGALSLYAPRGSYQIICSSMEQAGEGRILTLLEERKRRLAARGLFDESGKKRLPLVPSRVGVITSPTGAALRDILQVLSRRNSGIDVRILPSAVQGDAAAPELVRMLKLANRFSLADVLIIGRGGGSLEDLLPFSDERVVETVAASKIPVISAVGHEIDWALADYAADQRAPTPSAAAELVTAHTAELLHSIEERQHTLKHRIESRLRESRYLFERSGFPILTERMERIMQPLHLKTDDQRDQLVRSMETRLTALGTRVSQGKTLLQANSPLAVLKQGYAVVTDKKSGAVISDVNRTHTGDRIQIRVHTGALDAQIEEITHEDI